ncbi:MULTISPECIES: class I SAM-dependent methyltransferase [Aeromicrobium]|uniref:Methyltransferase domain-containing protein n=2 Tax=Aeromicrobium yanjiei TaxID=2662028 RepID=A0A5Q2MGJ8_9ACTN|nr:MULTISPECIES: methyltransferase domain-containing protein [Aeromicrobium]MRK03280.1 methyltransferase domain-containing protein [Aeromicrobium sp. S22]QGG40833.1 methyltransferase domain-containing protein [Aeromicrobium yanjiei]
MGRIKRAVLDQPEPRPRPAKKKKAPKPAPKVPAGVADPKPTLTRLELRRQSVLAGQGENPSILEIGPAHNPILPRREGYDTRNVDYLDRAGLIDKYKDFSQYSPDDIEDVDYVLPPGAKMSEEIPDRFDVVLASHVLEHTTSLIDFLDECARLTKPEGVVALVVPDHRFCFDRFRPRTSLGAIIDASLDPKGVHSVGTMTEFMMNAVRHRKSTSWAPGHRGDYDFLHGLDAAKAKAEEAKGETYIDVHHWIFSPNHLRLLLSDLHDLGYLGLREWSFHPTVGHEFFLNLSPAGDGPGIAREELLMLADAEQRDLDVPTFAQREPAEAQS